MLTMICLRLARIPFKLNRHRSRVQAGARNSTNCRSFLCINSPTQLPTAPPTGLSRSDRFMAVCARHSSVTWQLMLGKNLLWVAKQHGHSVEVMLRMYAAWLEGATESDIHAIKQAMEKRPAARAAYLDSRIEFSALNTVKNHVNQIVICPPKSPEPGSRLAIGKSGTTLSTGNDLEKKWRRGWDSNPRRRR
jgi:hypothetical protein